MHRNRIKGTLTPSNYEATRDPNILSQFARDMSKQYLRNVVTANSWVSDWHEKGLKLDRSSILLNGEKFLFHLNEVMNLPAAKALKFNGEIRVTVETDTEPLNYRIYVKEGVISYQTSSYLWEDVTPYTGS